ncbi:MAG TPA: autotransporter strand-loop-strand O-heptosyltransferase [Acetobacteraceae bacterium]|nr:autotransporter strand-loop-strand O-heptosyltransferase [Acetobacteraceae bacterium]
MTMESAADGEPVHRSSAEPPSPTSHGSLSGSSAPSAAKRPYPAPASVPTQEGPKGVRFDFNEGCRVTLPESDRPWHVVLRDLETGNVLFSTEIASGVVSSFKRYFVRFRVEVSQGGASVLTHDYDATDRAVLILLPIGTLGDTVGWLPYVARFQRKHRCQLTCGMAEHLIALFRDAYPEITFVPHTALNLSRYYATYYIGLFFDDAAGMWQPSDFRLVGLHRTAGYILGVDPQEEPPKIALGDDGPPIPDPYVVIATQSTTQCKYWNNPHGWRNVIAFLRQNGYRVICIDQKPVHGFGIVWNHIPNGAEDQTGDRPLTERARWIRHAAFFIGLSSGLSWLAWAVGTPVVMISGVTHPTNEFATPYRVVNYHACNSCWNDMRIRFDHRDFLWCPRHANTPRQFECTRLITPDHVMDAIRRIPGFATNASWENPVMAGQPGATN